MPFAFESFGSLGPAGVAFLRDLESYAKESFLPFHFYSSFFFAGSAFAEGECRDACAGCCHGKQIRYSVVGTLYRSVGVVH